MASHDKCRRQRWGQWGWGLPWRGPCTPAPYSAKHLRHMLFYLWWCFIYSCGTSEMGQGELPVAEPGMWKAWHLIRHLHGGVPWLLCSISQAAVPEQCLGAPLPSEGALLRRLPKLLKRMRKMCLTLIQGSPLPRLVEGLDQFTGGCMPRLRRLSFWSIPGGPGRLELITCVLVV